MRSAALTWAAILVAPTFAAARLDDPIGVADIDPDEFVYNQGIGIDAVDWSFSR